MKRSICVTITIVILSMGAAYAQEKKDVQPAADDAHAAAKKTWGNGFSIGIPVGLYNDDIIVGMEFAYPVIDTFVLRLNGHVIADRYRYNEIKWNGLKSKAGARAVLYPSLSLIGRSPLVYNLRLYGGATVGLAYVNKKMKVMPHVEGFAGVEFYAHKHHAFFIEVGGGSTITKYDIDFSRGALISGGTRFYF